MPHSMQYQMGKDYIERDTIYRRILNANHLPFCRVRGGRSPTPGRHVTITVRETKTENIPTNPGNPYCSFFFT